MIGTSERPPFVVSAALGGLPPCRRRRRNSLRGPALPRGPRPPGRTADRLRRRPPRLPLARARRVQLGARPFRRDRRRPGAATGRRCGSSRRTAARRSSASRRCRARSNQVANWLRSQGVARGDRVMLLLPNEVALWETMLAAMKLGAVIVPTTHAAGPDDLRRPLRPRRRQARDLRGRRRRQVRRLPRRVHARRRRTPRPPAGWLDYADARRAPRPSSRPTARRRPPTRCSSTSPRAPRPSPSSCCTPTRATRWGTCRRCTGSA